MPSWRVIEITSSSRKGPVFHLEKDNKHAEYRITKINKCSIALECTKGRCGSRLNLNFGGTLKTQKVGSVYKWLPDCINDVKEKQNYDSTVVHTHTRRRRCQVINNEGECLITRHNGENCLKDCSQGLKRQFLEEVKKIRDVSNSKYRISYSVKMSTHVRTRALN